MEQAMETKNVIDILNLSYTYPSREGRSLDGVTLAVRPGEFVLVSGPTGCGKSTLLRAMNGTIPHDSGGLLEGDVRVLGRSTREAPFAWIASRAGLVFQSPEDQLFSSRPVDEVAFGLENLRVEPTEIAERVRWALDEVGLADAAERPVAELSGGQKQRLAIAAVIAMRPSALLLDEPLSQLDPAGADQVLEVLERLRRDLGLAIVLVEHRMHTVARLADRVVLMDAGRIVLDSAARNAFDDLALYNRLGLRVPETVDLMQRLGRTERPLDMAAAVDTLRDLRCSGSESVIQNPKPKIQNQAASAPIVDLRGLRARYSRRGPEVLRGVDLRVDAGEVVAVMGANGSGKSTLLFALLGELRPSAGAGTVLGEDLSTRARRRRPGDVAMLLQNPDLMLLSDRVDEEVAAGPANLGLRDADVRRRAADAMEALGVADLAAEPPLALSRGQRLRVALASLLSMKPRLLLLDEPTTGQDRLQIESMMDHLVAQLDGRAVIFCTHDVSIAARYAHRVIVLSEGRVLAAGTPAEVFADVDMLSRAKLHPPVAAALARALGLPPVSSIEELARLLGAGGRP
jgi:energy-coupling factor transport system ATP-binding protein